MTMVKSTKFMKVSLIGLILISSLIGQSEWTENSFEDFRDGTFTDAGSNSYVSKAGRIQMITRWDFNNDGNLDIFLPGSHGHTERENTYIYLNKGKDVDGRSRIEIPGGGTRDGLVADFNKDGLNDILAINHTDSHARRVWSWIYYGTSDGFNVENRIDLESPYGTSAATGDFNDDGWLDVAIACQWWPEDAKEETVTKNGFIYWNSAEGFSNENRTSLSFAGKGPEDLASADLDKDGIDDLVASADGAIWLMLSSKGEFAKEMEPVRIEVPAQALALGDVNGDGNIDIAATTKEGVTVLPASKGSVYKTRKAITLKLENSKDVVLTDVNQDGFDDVVIAHFMTPGGATWTDSYVYYSDGKKFKKAKKLALPTLGANGVSSADINGDGYPELVFSHLRLTNQRNLLSYIYWNDAGTYRYENHTQLPTQGTLGNAIGDVNNDGLNDVIFFNDEGYFRDGPTQSHIYWGDGTRNFTHERSKEFQTHQIFGFGHADLDDDGNVELVMAQKNFVQGVNHDQGGLIINWKNDTGFDPPTHLTMKWGYGGVRIADINRDGYLDLLAGGYVTDQNDQSRHGIPIFWGSEQGYHFRDHTLIHYDGKRMRVPLLMDLNRDGWLDIAGQVKDGWVRFWWGSEDGFDETQITDLDLERDDHLMYLKAADFNKDGWLDLFLPKRGSPDGRKETSMLYYGSPDGFNNDNRIIIDAFVPYQNTISDVDQDGWLDLFLTSYGGEVSGNRPSLLYYGQEGGFKEKRDEFKTFGSSGSEIMDYDRDGYKDILISNHRRAGTTQFAIPHEHIVPQMLYWGGREGFSKENRWEMVEVGTSGLNPRDLGNSYDRELYEDYTSSVHELESEQTVSKINWEAEIQHGTKVTLQLRAAGTIEKLAATEWTGAKGLNTWFTKSGDVKGVSGKYVQYRARLSTPDGAGTPYLTSVRVTY